MIEINLVPENLKKKKKRRSLSESDSSVPKETVIGVIGGILVLLLIVHIALQFFITVQFVQHKQHKKEWEEIASQKAVVDKVMEELKTVRAKVQSIEEVTGNDPVLWAQKLNEISDNLPRGVWLNRITLDENTLLIQGSAVSKTSSEMADVHNFTANLKRSDAFMSHLDNIELGLIKSRNISTTQVADFTIMADLKE